MDETNIKPQPKKIKFYKKVWYSITKFDKYENMVNEGMRPALNYLCIISLICAVIFTIMQMVYIATTNNFDANTNYGILVLDYMIVYFISYLIVFLIFILLAMLVGFICSKIAKLRLNLKQLFSASVYSYTLSIIIIVIYSILNAITGITIKYIQIAYMLIAYIYLTTVIINERNKVKNNQKKL